MRASSCNDPVFSPGRSGVRRGRRSPPVRLPEPPYDDHSSKRPAQLRDHRPRRPWQDDARRRHALADRNLPQRPGRGRARDGLDGLGEGEGDHDPRQEHRGRPRRSQVQHRRHPGPRRLRRRGGAGADDGRRGAAAGRRVGGAAAADALRAAQGARPAAADHPRRQQGRPARRADLRGRRRSL